MHNTQSARRRNLRPVLIALTFGLAAACAAPQELPAQAMPGAGPETGPETGPVSGDVAPWRFEDHAGALAARSCPPGTRSLPPPPIPFTATPVIVAEAPALARNFPGNARLSGAWELSSSHATFGGLSGLALLPAEEGDLLAATDEGAFVWIDLEDGEPVGARMSYMQGPDGIGYSGKMETDAEGLVYRDGIALVSLERDFRIEAFALGTCGANARGIRVATLPQDYAGRQVHENQGPEAIFLTGEGKLGFGYEGVIGASPIGRVLTDGTAEWTGETAPAPMAHGLVGMEIVEMPDGSARTLHLYRAWDPLRGNRIRLTWGEGEAERLTISRPLLVDNFEGIAAEATGPNSLRVWIVSDDNFNRSQRTLLYVFDISL